MQYCSHPKYSDQHCANNDCWNYANACPRHAYSGRETQECTHDKVAKKLQEAK